VKRRLKTPPQKEAIIFLAGRMVPEKGILECAQALADILPSYPEWRLVIAGARRFEQANPNSYEAKVAKAIEPLGNQAEMTGFIPLDQVRDWQERAAIAACPSLWQEPLGKVVVEALAAGCAVLTTRRGGIPEVAEGRALIIDKPSVATFRDGFAKLLKDDPFRHQLQSIAFADFPFTSTAMANKVDALRQAAFDTGWHRHRR
jgi:glycosyltransferase involved in cell wall biosynthesis